MTVGERLRMLRISRGITQQKLADDLGISQTSVAAYENRGFEPSFEILSKFSAYYNLPVTSLVPPETERQGDLVIQIADAVQDRPALRAILDCGLRLSGQDLATAASVANAFYRKSMP